MPMKDRFTRRGAIFGVGALGLLPVLLGGRGAYAATTPAQTEGPYYPRKAMRFSDQDNDLVKIADQVQQAGGEIIFLKGQVLNEQGKPVSGARVEIWQTDANGRYLHTGDYNRTPRDGAFQGFGHDITDDQGRYLFRTIKPTPYPGRTPHIHVKVLAGKQELTTQFYLDGHPQNPRDGIWLRLSPQGRDMVAMRFQPGSDGPEATVNIYL